MEYILGLIISLLSSLITAIDWTIRYLNSVNTKHIENDSEIKKYSAQISPKVIGALITKISSIETEVDLSGKLNKKRVMNILQKTLKQEIVAIKSEISELNVKADSNKIIYAIDLILEDIAIKIVNNEYLKFLNFVVPNIENAIKQELDTIISEIQQKNVNSVFEISKIINNVLIDEITKNLKNVRNLYKKLSVQEEIQSLLKYYATMLFEHNHIKCYENIKSKIAHVIIKNFVTITNEFRLQPQQSRFKINDIISKILNDDLNLIILEIQENQENLNSKELKFLVDSALTRFSDAISINEVLEYRQYIESKVTQLVNSKLKKINENIELIGTEDPIKIYNIINETLKDEFNAIIKEIENQSIRLNADEISKELHYAIKRVSLIITTSVNHTSFSWFEKLVKNGYYYDF